MILHPLQALAPGGESFDRVIREQAAYWGMTPERHAAFTNQMAEAQEEAEASEEFLFAQMEEALGEEIFDLLDGVDPGPSPRR